MTAPRREDELQHLKTELKRLEAENARLNGLVYRDALTGLRNRRFFSERLKEELSRVRRHHLRGEPALLSLACLDVNDFKQLNDRLGHSHGDAALVAVAQLIESLVRGTDIACRVGGDEFALLLPDTSAAEAAVVLARLRAHLPLLRRTGLPEAPVAVGVATYLPGDDEVSLLARADEAMYLDKRGARSLVAVPEESWAADA